MELGRKFSSGGQLVHRLGEQSPLQTQLLAQHAASGRCSRHASGGASCITGLSKAYPHHQLLNHRALSVTCAAGKGAGGSHDDNGDDSDTPEPIEPSLTKAVLSTWWHGGTVLSTSSNQGRPAAAQTQQQAPAELQRRFIDQQNQLLPSYFPPDAAAGRGTIGQQQHRKVLETHLQLLPKLMSQYHQARSKQRDEQQDDARSRQHRPSDDATSLVLPDMLHLLLLGMPGPSPSGTRSASPSSNLRARSTSSPILEPGFKPAAGSGLPESPDLAVGGVNQQPEEAIGDPPSLMQQQQQQEQQQQRVQDQQEQQARAQEMYVYARHLLGFVARASGLSASPVTTALSPSTAAASSLITDFSTTTAAGTNADASQVPDQARGAAGMAMDSNGQTQNDSGIAADGGSTRVAPPPRPYPVFEPLFRKAVEVAGVLSAAPAALEQRGPAATRRRRLGLRRENQTASAGGAAGAGLEPLWAQVASKSTWQGGTGARDASNTPALLHHSMYRMLRLSCFSPLRHTITLQECDPSKALVAWALVLSGGAIAMHLSALDVQDASSCQSTAALLRDIARGTQHLAAFEEQSHSPFGSRWGTAARVHALSQQVCVLQQRRAAITGSAAARPRPPSKTLVAAASQLQAALESLTGKTLLSNTRTLTTTSNSELLAKPIPTAQQGSGTMEVQGVPLAAAKVSGNTAHTTAVQLLSAGDATAQGSAGGEGEASTPAAVATSQSPLETPLQLPLQPPLQLSQPLAYLTARHALIAADGWHRLGSFHALCARHAVAVECFGRALEAYETFDRATCDNLQEFDQGEDHLLFASMALDSKATLGPQASTTSRSVWLYRDRIRCAASLLSSHVLAQHHPATAPTPPTPPLADAPSTAIIPALPSTSNEACNATSTINSTTPARPCLAMDSVTSAPAAALTHSPIKDEGTNSMSRSLPSSNIHNNPDHQPAFVAVSQAVEGIRSRGQTDSSKPQPASSTIGSVAHGEQHVALLASSTFPDRVNAILHAFCEQRMAADMRIACSQQQQHTTRQAAGQAASSQSTLTDTTRLPATATPATQGQTASVTGKATALSNATTAALPANPTLPNQNKPRDEPPTPDASATAGVLQPSQAAVHALSSPDATPNSKSGSIASSVTSSQMHLLAAATQLLSAAEAAAQAAPGSTAELPLLHRAALTILQCSFALEQAIRQAARPQASMITSGRRRRASRPSPQTLLTTNQELSGQPPDHLQATSGNASSPSVADAQQSATTLSQASGSRADVPSTKQSTRLRSNSPQAEVATAQPAQPKASERPVMAGAAGVRAHVVLMVEGVGVATPRVAKVYAGWYRTQAEIMVTGFKKRLAGRFSAITRAMSAVGSEAEAWHQLHHAAPRPLSDPIPPTTTKQGHDRHTHTADNAQHSSSLPVSTRSRSPSPVAARLSGAGAVFSGASSPTAPPSGAWQALVTQCNLLLQLWRERPCGVMLEPKQQAWLVLAASLDQPPVWQPTAASAASPPAPTTGSPWNQPWSTSDDEDDSVYSQDEDGVSLGILSVDVLGEGGPIDNAAAGLQHEQAGQTRWRMQPASQVLPSSSSSPPLLPPPSLQAGNRRGTRASLRATTTNALPSEDAVTAATAASSADASSKTGPASQHVPYASLLTGQLPACAAARQAPLRVQSLLDNVTLVSTPVLPLSLLSSAAATMATSTSSISPWHAHTVALLIQRRGHLDGLLVEHATSATSSTNTTVTPSAASPAPATSSSQVPATTQQPVIPQQAASTAPRTAAASPAADPPATVSPAPAPASAVRTARLRAHASQQRLVHGLLTLAAQRHLLQHIQAGRARPGLLRYMLPSAMPVELKIETMRWLVNRRTPAALHLAINGLCDLQARYLAANKPTAPHTAASNAPTSAISLQAPPNRPSMLPLASASPSPPAPASLPMHHESASASQPALSTAMAQGAVAMTSRTGLALGDRSGDDMLCVMACPSALHLDQAARLLVAGALDLPQQHAATALFCVQAVAPALAHEATGRELFMDVVAALLRVGPHPYLVLELAKDLVSRGSMAAVPVCLLLARHCATYRIEHPLQALLTHLLPSMQPAPQPPQAPAQPGTRIHSSGDNQGSSERPIGSSPAGGLQGSGVQGTDGDKGLASGSATASLLVHSLLNALMLVCVGGGATQQQQADVEDTDSMHTAAGGQPGRPGRSQENKLDSDFGSTTPGSKGSSSSPPQSPRPIACTTTSTDADVLPEANRHWLAKYVGAAAHAAAEHHAYQPADEILVALVDSLSSASPQGTISSSNARDRSQVMTYTMWAVGKHVVEELERQLDMRTGSSPAHALLRLLRHTDQARVLGLLCERAPHLALGALALVLEEAGKPGSNPTGGGAGRSSTGLLPSSRAAASTGVFPGAGPAQAAGAAGSDSVVTLKRQIRHGLAAVSLLQELAQQPLHWSGPMPTLLVALHRVHQAAVSANQAAMQQQQQQHADLANQISQLQQQQQQQHADANEANQANQQPAVPNVPDDSQAAGQQAAASAQPAQPAPIETPGSLFNQRGLSPGTGRQRVRRIPTAAGKGAPKSSPLVARLPHSVLIRVVLSYALLSAPTMPDSNAPPIGRDTHFADGVLLPPLSPAAAGSQALYLLQQHFLRPADAAAGLYQAANQGTSSSSSNSGASSTSTSSTERHMPLNDVVQEQPKQPGPAVPFPLPSRPAAVDALYDLLGEALRSRLAPHPALASLLRLACSAAVRLACATAVPDRALLVRALVAALQADQLPLVARDLTPAEVLRAASAGIQSRQLESARLLLKHLAGQHGLRSSALAPHFAEFVNGLAMVAFMQPSTSLSATTPDVTAGQNIVEIIGGRDPAFGVYSVKEYSLDASYAVRVDGGLRATAEDASLAASSGGLLDLGGCEPYVCAMLVQLSRDSEVDLARALTGAAKRLAIRLCVSQGAHVTALKLWAAWQARHSAGDVGRSAACWLLVACAEVGDWAAGQQLVRFLGPDMLLATFLDAESGASEPLEAELAPAVGDLPAFGPTPSSASKVHAHDSCPDVQQQNGSGRSNSSLVRTLQSRVLGAYLRVIAALGGALQISPWPSLSPPQGPAQREVTAQPSRDLVPTSSVWRGGDMGGDVALVAGSAGGGLSVSSLAVLDEVVRGNATLGHKRVGGTTVLAQLYVISRVIEDMCTPSAVPSSLPPPSPPSSGRKPGRKKARGTQPPSHPDTASAAPDLDQYQSLPGLPLLALVQSSQGSASGQAADPVLTVYVVLDFLLGQLQQQDVAWQRLHARQVALVAADLMQALTRLQTKQQQQQQQQQQAIQSGELQAEEQPWASTTRDMLTKAAQLSRPAALPKVTAGLVPKAVPAQPPQPTRKKPGPRPGKSQATKVKAGPDMPDRKPAVERPKGKARAKKAKAGKPSDASM